MKITKPEVIETTVIEADIVRSVVHPSELLLQVNGENVARIAEGGFRLLGCSYRLKNVQDVITSYATREDIPEYLKEAIIKEALQNHHPIYAKFIEEARADGYSAGQKWARIEDRKTQPEFSKEELEFIARLVGNHVAAGVPHAMPVMSKIRDAAGQTISYVPLPVTAGTSMASGRPILLAANE